MTFKFHIKEKGEIEECNKGVIVKVEDIPDAGLTVDVGNYSFFPLYHSKDVAKKKVSAVFSEITFLLIPAAVVWVRVKNEYGQVMDKTEEAVEIPEIGCAEITLYGWLGRPYRSRIEVEPPRPVADKIFTLKAILIYNPDEVASANLTVVFFKSVIGVWKRIGEGSTDPKGIARFSTSEPEGIYTYKAEYDPEGKSTFPETKRVNVRSEVPVCPLMRLLGGTFIAFSLPHIRVFRDKVLRRCALGRAFVNWYYSGFSEWANHGFQAKCIDLFHMILPKQKTKG